MKFSLRLIKSGFEASNSITVGSNTQPWGSAKHQGIGDFIINSGATVNMVAGQSVKLKSGFKLNSGAKFKAKVDPTNPTLKSSLIEKLYTPVIVGDKNATTRSIYSIEKQLDDEDVQWLLLGNDFEYSSKTDVFSLPDNLSNGQYTLVCKIGSNGQEASSSKIIIVNKSKDNNDNQEKLGDKSCDITVFPNPAKNLVIIDFGDNDYINAEIELKDITGKTITHYGKIGSNKFELNITTVTKGVYFIRIINDGANIETKKIIKL